MLQYFAILCATISAIILASSSAQLSDSTALLSFKSKADSTHKINFTSHHFCKWTGVQCHRLKVVRLVIEHLDLVGIFPPNTLTRLDQLRVLSLQNNSLTGPIPDLSPLINLKSLFLSHNTFTGTFPSSIATLHRLTTLHLSYNNLTGPLPVLLTSLHRLYELRLECNQLSGNIPPLNQSSLQTFNVSVNSLTGAIPVTSTLLRFGTSSFTNNPGLCGEIIKKECNHSFPFFGSSGAPPPKSEVLGQTADLHRLNLTQRSREKHKRTAIIVGFSCGLFILIVPILGFILAIKKHASKNRGKRLSLLTPIISKDEVAETVEAAVAIQESELEEKVKRVQVEKSGSLVFFCAGEAPVYTVEQLMRASAELLGRGTIGTTYKGVLDEGLIVSVKRLDGSKMGGVGKEIFERHMESVGGLRHPNLVAMRAYFQANEERLVVYDYQPNGSLFSLIHGSKSTRANALHWTSCLKIAQDIAQGISYIHQAWRLVHGNLKSTNILLGPDFEACLVDYCLTSLSEKALPDASPYKAPEMCNSSNYQPTAKTDAYSYGVVLLELLTGVPPSQHPNVAGEEMMKWVKTVREDEDGDEEDKMEMLIEVTMACKLTSAEHRPRMWQVLKMLQEIKQVAGNG